MSGYKRKRFSSDARALAVYRPFKSDYKKRKTFSPGKDRTGGYYGRFSGPVGRGMELKFFDVDLTDAVVATAGTVVDSINKIGQGITENTRIGRKCTLRSFTWRYEVSLQLVDDQAVTPRVGDTCRVILYVDKQCNGATATVTDILETAAFHSHRNLSNSGRFTILCDKLHNINYFTLMKESGTDALTQIQVVHNYTFYKKLNLPIEFDSTTGAITEIRSNNLGILLISAKQSCTFDSKIRLRFSDL